MPEWPDLHVVRGRLEKALVGKEIVLVRIGDPRRSGSSGLRVAPPRFGGARVLDQAAERSAVRPSRMSRI